MFGDEEFNIENEFADLDFNSVRLEKRFIKTTGTLKNQPDKSIWRGGKSAGESKAIYRMPGNDNLSYDKILETHRNKTILRMIKSKSKILPVQDTTPVNYSTHLKTKGIGFISDKTTGVNIHTCLAVTGAGLAPGVSDQSNYNRKEAKDETVTPKEKQARNIEGKESNRWLITLETGTKDIPGNIDTLTVCGREGDMYGFFAKAKILDGSMLIRVVQNRMTIDNERILTGIRPVGSKGTVGVTIPRDSRNNIAKHEPVLELRFEKFSVKKPKILNSNTTISDTIDLNIIYVKEKNPAKSRSPIEWFLATNDSIETCDDAYKYVEYYIQRWKIERFHFVLKSGCAIEKLQERGMDKNVTLILMYSVIAVKIMNLTYAGRVLPNALCSNLLDSDEWKLLYRVEHQTTKSPKKPYSIEEAVKYPGNLGGTKCAPGAGLPGLKTIWLGLMKLYTLLSCKNLLACDFVGQV